MNRTYNGYRRIIPQRGTASEHEGGDESFHESVPGPLIYTMRMPPAKSRIRRYPDGRVESEPIPPEEQKTQEELGFCLFSDRPFIPSVEEIARLPRNCRVAFLQRCAARVCKLRPSDLPCPTELDPFTAAALILAHATVEMPVRRQLQCIRNDFDRIRYKVYQHHWTDDTPVPPEVFGRMWPKTLAPAWAKEPT